VCERLVRPSRGVGESIENACRPAVYAVPRLYMHVQTRPPSHSLHPEIYAFRTERLSERCRLRCNNSSITGESISLIGNATWAWELVADPAAGAQVLHTDRLDRLWKHN
jgi:hypothetical protein